LDYAYEELLYELSIDLKTPEGEIEANQELIMLINTYIEEGDLEYEEVLEIAKEIINPREGI
jgi:hypothetical protein